MFSSLQFWTLVVGLLVFVLKFYVPTFPFDEAQILAFTLFILGLIGIYPKLRARAGVGDIVRSLQFWTLIAGLIGFVLHFYFPSFPFEDAVILGLILFVLKLFGITPDVLEYAAVYGVRVAEQLGGTGDEKKAYALEAAASYLRLHGALRVDYDTLGFAIEKAVYDQFNDPIVHKYMGL